MRALHSNKMGLVTGMRHPALVLTTHGDENQTKLVAWRRLLPQSSLPPAREGLAGLSEKWLRRPLMATASAYLVYTSAAKAGVSER